MNDAADRKYFEWMVELVTDDNGNFRNSHSVLLEYLDMCDFYCKMEQDENRLEDGLDLRRRFSLETGSMIPNTETRLETASVLEVIVALLLRIEEAILFDPEEKHMPKIFLDIMDNLGLLSMDNAKWNEKYADSVIERFLTRRYSRNGKGGLFFTSGNEDMRTIEIWYQMMIYLNENY